MTNFLIFRPMICGPPFVLLPEASLMSGAGLTSTVIEIFIAPATLSEILDSIMLDAKVQFPKTHVYMASLLIFML